MQLCLVSFEYSSIGAQVKKQSRDICSFLEKFSWMAAVRSVVVENFLLILTGILASSSTSVKRKENIGSNHLLHIKRRGSLIGPSLVRDRNRVPYKHKKQTILIDT